MGIMRQLKFCEILVIFCCSFLSVHSQSSPSLNWQFDPFSIDQWFKQKVDHYDSSNIQYWPQRYVTSYRFYRLGGPVFLMLSGPGPELSLTDIESGAIAEYAEEQGAFVIGLEHRYYGKSRPTEDLSTKSLQFLTVPQTLEDIAAFIRQWKSRDEFKHSKLVVFGASYLGSVAAWFSQKHPELIDGFVASSPPLELRYEIPEFLESAGIVLNKTDPKCYETVAESFSCLQKIFNEQGCEGYTLDDVKEKFNFCAELDPSRPLDASGAIAELFSTVNAVIMYHDPGPESFPDTNLDRFCRHITRDNGKTALDKLGEKVKEINRHRKIPCAEFRFETTVKFLDETAWDSDAAKEGYRQLQWQLCNELGWTVASSNISQPFGNYLSPFLHSEICQKLFGLTETQMRLKVLQANTELKGKQINTKCGIYVNGDMDPWHTYSITTAEEAGKCNRAILIEGGSHARDIEDFTDTPSHPPEVREAQIKIARYLDYFLKTGKCCDEDPSYINSLPSLPRSIRAPNPEEFASFASEMLRRPMNVQIRSRGEPIDNGEKLVASPTSIPRLVSTTDVLSVSPRIPVAAEETAEEERPLKRSFDMYRDPRTAEIRKYRVVKLLRHRPSFVPLEQEQSPVPSMEQFEADFPEHSLRVEGKVERVYKNGTRISSGEDKTAMAYSQISRPPPEVNKRLELFNRGRKLLLQTASPQQTISPTPKTIGKGSKDDEDDGNNSKQRFRYVVKQVFKDVVEPEPVNATSTGKEFETKAVEAGETDIRKNEESPTDSKATTKRQGNLEGVAKSKKEKEVSGEDESGELRVKVTRKQSVSKVTRKKGKTREAKSDDDDDDENYEDEDYSDEDYESTEDDDDIDDDDDDEYEYEEDEATHESDDNKREIRQKDKATSTKPTPTSTTVSSKSLKKNARKSNASTEFSSGEDTRPLKLREKISEKIMSSSEDFEGDQKSKEKADTGKNKSRGRSSKSDGGNDSEESLENSSSSSKEFYSDEDSNQSLEPSGSNPQGQFQKSSKKQLAPIAKPVIEEPDTVINVEISGSYPKRSSHRHKKKGRKTTTTQAPSTTTEDKNSSESSEESGLFGQRFSTEEPVTQRPKKTRIVVRRRKIKRPSSTTRIPSTTTITTSTSTTTEAPSTEKSEPTSTNNYATWNKDKLIDKNPEVQSKPVQQENPSVVDLGSSNYPGPETNGDNIETPNAGEGFSTDGGNKNDVVYIIIGDIPPEDNEVDNGPPSHDALFRFIQKLVNRHSSGITGQKPIPFPTPNQSYIPPSPTTTEFPPPPPITYQPPQPQQPPRNLGYDEHIGKYLLVRPVQVIPLGREHVIHANDLKNESLIEQISTGQTNKESFENQYHNQLQNTKLHNRGAAGQYEFKSPLHRNNFERLLSVDEQVRDSDRVNGGGRQHYSFSRRLDQTPDPSWRSIRGISQFGPVLPPSGSTSGLLSLSAADTQWVDAGVPFLPRGNRHF